jgi:hypothetical protein
VDADIQATLVTSITDCFSDEEPGAQIWERRWFAASAAVKSVQAECEVLLGVVQLAVDEWRRSCAQLSRLEALRDALGERLASMDEPRATSGLGSIRREEMSAA